VVLEAEGRDAWANVRVLVHESNIQHVIRKSGVPRVETRILNAKLPLGSDHSEVLLELELLRGVEAFKVRILRETVQCLLTLYIVIVLILIYVPISIHSEGTF
jgi:hypothetical protein